MSEPTAAEKDATKARMRAALDVLQNYTTEDGRLDATKLTQRIRELEADNERLRARLASARRLLRIAQEDYASDMLVVGHGPDSKQRIESMNYLKGRIAAIDEFLSTKSEDI